MKIQFARKLLGRFLYKTKCRQENEGKYCAEFRGGVRRFIVNRMCIVSRSNLLYKIYRLKFGLYIQNK